MAFMYPPLSCTSSGSSIRLIELDVHHEPEVRCTLHARALRSEDSFIALSYTWGESSLRVRIQMDGKPFLISHNLHQALLAIRKRLREAKEHDVAKLKSTYQLKKLSLSIKNKQLESKYSKYGTPYFTSAPDSDHVVPLLWIDQLCINQVDVKERNSQVELMAQIYSNARVVLVWLGKPEQLDDVPGAIACLEASNNAITRNKKWKQWPRPTEGQKDVIEAIASNSYWTRLWIVQELILARHALVQVGDVVFEYGELLPLFIRGPGGTELNWTFAHRSFRHWRIEDTPMGHLLWLRSTLQDLHEAQSPLTLHMLLMFMQKQQCSDRRDRVFGLLGLMQARGWLDVRDFSANYDLNVDEVYAAVLDYAVGQKQISDVNQAMDLCRRAATALGVDLDDELIICRTAELLIEVHGDKYDPWETSLLRRDNPWTLEDAKDRVRKYRWT